MPQPISPDNSSWLATVGWKIAEILFGAFLAAFWWFVRRDIKRFDDALQTHARDISELKQDRVSRNDLDELRESLTATVVHGFERMDTRIEKRHDENIERNRETKSDMQYIRERLDKALDK